LTRFTKQHYVPRFYLRNFCNSDGTIFCYDKLKSKSFRVNINDIAHENFFYDVSELNPATVEKSMAEKEKIFSKVYTYLIRRKSLEGIRADTKEAFFLFLATQYLRTKEFRIDIKDSYEQLANLVAKEKGIKIPEHLRIFMTEDSAKRMHLDMLMDPKVVFFFAGTLGSRKWIVLENPTEEPLWTSDHPVTFFNIYSYAGNMGILSPGVQIHFPLSDKLCLTSYDPKFERVRNDKMVHENVVFHNELQVQSSYRFVYSQNNDFGTAARYLNVNPEARDPNRTRSILRSDPSKYELLRSRRWTRIK
jgi:hypothetical protein